MFFIFIVIISVSCSNKSPEVSIIESNYTPSPDTILVATPQGYSQNKTYPVVILLHGWSGNYKQWNSIVPIQDLANAYDFIIACPDGFYDSWYLNNPLKPDVQYEDFFSKDFISYLTNNYSIDTNNIFISGLSMGGHGAITLYLKYPDIIKSAGSSSGILDLTYFPDRWSIKDGIGSIKDFPKTWKNNSAIHLIDSLMRPDLNMIIDCGTSDFAYPVNLNFANKCYDLGIGIEFISIAGDHNRKHWKKMIGKHFEFFKQRL